MVLVSAVIPTYNRAEYVAGAIDCVLAQTHDRIEAVVVNDGSTDETARVLAEYAEDDRVRVFHNERNRGIGYSFDRAVEEANGEFVGILGDDDRWHPRKIELQLDRFARAEDTCCGVYTGGIHRDETGEIVQEVVPRVEGDVYPEILLQFELLPHSSHLLRRECLRAVGGFDRDFPHAVDWEVSIRLAREYTFAFVPKVLVERRFHDDNISGDVRSGDPAYQVDARERLWRKHRDALDEHPEVRHRFVATLEKHRGRAALDDGDQRRAVAHFLAASWLVLDTEHVGSLLAAGLHPRVYRFLQGRRG